MRLADLIEKNGDELAALETLNNGAWSNCFLLDLLWPDICISVEA